MRRTGMVRVACGSAICGWLLAVPADGSGQTRSTGFEMGGLPALNFDADEGVGYGAVAQLYQYGDGSRAPYQWMLQPTVFLTTEGRRGKISASIPMNEILKYTNILKSLTSGRGSFTMRFDRYEEAPANIREQVQAAYVASKEED